MPDLVYNEKFNDLWVEKYRPQRLKDVVLPDYLMEKFQEYIDKSNIPNIMFVSSTPGCSVEGNNVEVRVDSLHKKELLKKFPLLKSKTLFENLTYEVSKDTFEVNEIAYKKISENWDKNKSRIINLIKEDKKFKSKYPKFIYWLNFKTFEEAVETTKRIRRRKKYFENDFKDLNFKQNIDGKVTLLKLRKAIIDNKEMDFFEKQQPSTVSFWVNRGFSIEEAQKQVFMIQSKNGKIKSKLVKEHP